jgi:hypothetical protein
MALSIVGAQRELLCSGMLSVSVKCFVAELGVLSDSSTAEDPDDFSTLDLGKLSESFSGARRV